jgi:hypothetical protein
VRLSPVVLRTSKGRCTWSISRMIIGKENRSAWRNICSQPLSPYHLTFDAMLSLKLNHRLSVKKDIKKDIIVAMLPMGTYYVVRCSDSVRL